MPLTKGGAVLKVKTVSKTKRYLLIGLIVFVAIGVAATLWLVRLDHNIAERFAQKRFAPPVEFYSAPERIVPGSVIPQSYFLTLFARKHYRERQFGQPLHEGDYSVWTGDQCRTLIDNLPETLTYCLAFHNSMNDNGEQTLVQLLAFEEGNKLTGVWAGTPLVAIEAAELEPELFAQYYGDKPILRKTVSNAEIPVSCREALLAIEDPAFYEHGGISVTGLARAVLKNLKAGGYAQGGSTLTQQLVKNYFLSSEKKLSRKIKEIAMAILVEGRISKDDIFETYVNLIYLGQNGPFEIRGYGAASEYYFGTTLSDLNLPQCALLAAVVNSPGLYNPFNKIENATSRRAKVLDKMVEQNFISQADANEAKKAPLPKGTVRALTEPAPYFVQAVRREIAELGIDESEGLKVFTTLNLRAQEAAHLSVRQGLDRIESTAPTVKKLKAQGKNLEAVLISADPKSGEVQAIVGGRSYVATQFNRAIDGHRQIGSVMKPFVYLTALESVDENGQAYEPTTVLPDKPFTHAYQGQKWSPKNYDGKFFGDVPMFFALKSSLNAATAWLGLKVGLDNIIDVARRAGVTSPMQPVPSLTLGAFELYPREVLQAYTTLTNLGDYVPLKTIHRIEDALGSTLLENASTREQRLDPTATSMLVGMMKQTIISGTARYAVNGFTNPAAGKTGTTNDKKDSWFAGFTPYHTAIVWVGYDDNTSHNLTGATGAAPIWAEYMKSYGVSFPNTDFQWPESTSLREVKTENDSAILVFRR